MCYILVSTLADVFSLDLDIAQMYQDSFRTEKQQLNDSPHDSEEDSPCEKMKLEHST